MLNNKLEMGKFIRLSILILLVGSKIMFCSYSCPNCTQGTPCNYIFNLGDQTGTNVIPNPFYPVGSIVDLGKVVAIGGEISINTISDVYCQNLVITKGHHDDFIRPDGQSLTLAMPINATFIQHISIILPCGYPNAHDGWLLYGSTNGVNELVSCGSLTYIATSYLQNASNTGC